MKYNTQCTCSTSAIKTLQRLWTVFTFDFEKVNAKSWKDNLAYSSFLLTVIPSSYMLILFKCFLFTSIFSNLDERSAKKALVWVCEYIDFQAKQPPPAHSKDLHSIIIAAFSCISTWLSHHPWLMDDHVSSKNCLSVFKPLTVSPTKWSNTLKQFVDNSRRIVWVCLTIL